MARRAKDNGHKNGHWKDESLRTLALQDPQSLPGMAEKYLEWMATTNYSPGTIRDRRVHLGYFFTWCEERGLTKPHEITKPIIERYQRYLFHYRKIRDGKPLPVRTQHARLVPIRTYFKWLARKNHILYNPASDIDMPRTEFRLPRQVMAASEAEMVINVPDVTELLGLRDRAILETFYSTGIRRAELARLSIYDLDAERGVLMIHQGKGGKDRMVPIGERAIQWVQKYLYEVRPRLVLFPDQGTLFLTGQGGSFNQDSLTALVRDYVKRSDCGKKGSCHLFRHTMATLMLENGADLRTIQEILGHANLATTQIYTHVSIQRLKEVHNLTHPANLPSSKAEEVRKELEAELIGDTLPSLTIGAGF
jgi:integrase/recombinase XerD